jgi:hypothetical protein
MEKKITHSMAKSMMLAAAAARHIHYTHTGVYISIYSFTCCYILLMVFIDLHVGSLN